MARESKLKGRETELIEAYTIRKESCSQIALIFNVERSIIRLWLKKLGISRRSKKGSSLTVEQRQRISDGIVARGGQWNRGTGNGANPEKTKLRQRKYIQRHPDRRKETSRTSAHRWRMKNLYNLTDERYQEMYENQKGLCALPSCGKPAEHIDHCHETNTTRGLLCARHNTSLGKMWTPVLLREAAEYLENFNGKQ